MPTDTTYVTPEEYLAAERAATHTRSEWIDGEVREMTGASYAHIMIVSNLVTMLGNRLSRRPFAALPNDMKVRVPGGPYYYPDVSVTPAPPAFEGARNDIVLNPLVIVEVLSPSTETIDRGEKLDNYRLITSLTDYLLVEQDECRVEQFARQDDGSWRRDVHRALGTVVPLPSIGCELPLRDVYDRIVEG